VNTICLYAPSVVHLYALIFVHVVKRKHISVLVNYDQQLWNNSGMGIKLEKPLNLKTKTKLMKGKALRKHNLHEKTAASVLL